MALFALVLQSPVRAETLRQAWRADVPDAALPADAFPAQAGARLVNLPDDDAGPDAAPAQSRWYRIGFTLPEAVPTLPLQGLHIPHLCAGAELQLNGQLLHRQGVADRASAATCDRPLLLALPPALLRAGPNVLDLRLWGPPRERVGSRHRAMALSQLELGPLDAVQPLHQRRMLLQVSLRQALAAALLLTGGYMFVLGSLSRRENAARPDLPAIPRGGMSNVAKPHLLMTAPGAGAAGPPPAGLHGTVAQQRFHESRLAYFGMVSATWALLDLPLWLDGVPLSQAAFETARAALLALLALASVQFLLRDARLRWHGADRLLPLQVLVMPATVAVAGADQVHQSMSLWTVVLALQVIAAAWVHLRRQWQGHAPSLRVTAALLALLALAGVVETLAQAQATPPDTVMLARLLVPTGLVLMGLRLVQQHGRALQEAEADKAELEQRVREAAAEIERNFRQLADLKIEQVTERERKRIAADLHDDLGAKLLTIVHTSESDRISTLAREALEEMRLSVRGLTGRPVRLADALGDWRAEVVSRLAQAGIEAEWSAPEDLPQTLSARAYVQTTRILREATSNIIKHSGASFCAVRCQVADGDFQLVVQDNGEGITSEPDGRLDRGHGMATMKQRAKQMQGQCLVESGPGFGTVIRLTLPLDRAVEGS